MRCHPWPVLLAASCIVGPAMAANWVYVATSDAEVPKHIDIDSITRSGDLVYVWEKSDHAKEKAASYASEKDRRLYDCTARRSKLLNAFEYSSDGTVLRSFSWGEQDADWNAIVPDSIGEATFDFACHYSPPPPG